MGWADGFFQWEFPAKPERGFVEGGGTLSTKTRGGAGNGLALSEFN